MTPGSAANLLCFFVVFSCEREPPDAAGRARVRADTIYRYAHEARGSSACPTPAQVAATASTNVEKLFTDPWGNKFILECHGDKIHVGSVGRD
ncbi:MAG TPA: hypothetical protein PKA88_35740, partial [Polyangiaceae bacterium]|nr:hypothetical protein [Polyangiaceae bacterium]